MPTPKMTEDEIISYLGKTSLPTLLVEGEDDAEIYRWLEHQLGIVAGNILICSGRNALVSIYRQRDTFPHGKMAWLADLDMWRFSAPPSDLAGIIFTSGYSIENDLYAGSDIEALMGTAERSRHARLLAAACRWFAFEILEFRAGRQPKCATSIKRVVDLTTLEIDPDFVKSRGFTEPAPELVADLTADYKLQLRGKTLLEVLVVLLSDPSRSSKYSHRAVVEMCLKFFPHNPHIQRIINQAKAQLA